MNSLGYMSNISKIGYQNNYTNIDHSYSSKITPINTNNNNMTNMLSTSTSVCNPNVLQITNDSFYMKTNEEIMKNDEKKKIKSPKMNQMIKSMSDLFLRNTKKNIINNVIKTFFINKHQHAKNPRQHFTKEEDCKLQELVKIYGDRNWSSIASEMNGRTARQCRERYSNYLIPGFFQGEWSKDEDDLLINLYKKNGPKWLVIKKHFPNRSSNAIKNRWNYFLKTRKEKLFIIEEQEDKNVNDLNCEHCENHENNEIESNVVNNIDEFDIFEDENQIEIFSTMSDDFFSNDEFYLI